MPYVVKVSEAALKDLTLVFEHLRQSYMEFGEDEATARLRAAERIRDIQRHVERIAALPHQGTLRPEFGPNVRSLTHQKAIYWFEVDEDAEELRVLAIFFGGQDHIRHMLRRLLK
ncbi:MAG: type II toxin-antitoxin system RelE/ParE family toxin [Rhodothalassiaceae bacterium]